jgi:hypothetical protein
LSDSFIDDQKMDDRSILAGQQKPNDINKEI